MRPRLLRPPGRFCPLVNCLTGGPLCRPERSTNTNWRWALVTGLKVLSAIIRLLQSGCDVDLVTLDEGHNGFPNIAFAEAPAAKGFQFALRAKRVHRLHF